ncbi:hypothetical protein BDL97_10G029200 [Sphagnum fallax]|nr:hypothetical protein BDL97_10G029200 [Sphagnum fallax]
MDTLTPVWMIKYNSIHVLIFIHVNGKHRRAYG